MAYAPASVGSRCGAGAWCEPRSSRGGCGGGCAAERMGPAEQHLRRALAAMAGPQAQPREDQAAAVAALVEQRSRVLVVQATGWGKSAVYWAATSALRAEGKGPTLIVSPLLALMVYCPALLNLINAAIVWVCRVSEPTGLIVQVTALVVSAPTSSIESGWLIFSFNLLIAI